jgi:hypothetical protein
MFQNPVYDLGVVIYLAVWLVFSTAYQDNSKQACAAIASFRN